MRKTLGLTSAVSFILALRPGLALAEAPALPMPKGVGPALEQTIAQDGSEHNVSALGSDTGATAVTEDTKSKTFIADGTALNVDRLGIKITPPSGFEVTVNGGSLSLVMQEPKDTRPDYEKAKYQRNITVAAIHHPSTIDEARAKELEGELAKSFGADTLVSNFQILEHRFFNYRGTNDGLLVYTSLNIGEFPMLQAHILVSGAEKQFLLSYTDLAERFTDDKNGAFASAWTSMTSLEVTGVAPERDLVYAKIGAFAGVCCMFGLALFFFRRRTNSLDYSAEADALMDQGDDVSASPSLIATLARGWRLDDAAGDGGNQGLEFSGVGARSDAFSVTNF